MTEMERLMDQIQRSFVADAWHGPSVLEVLCGVSAETARQRPIAGGHSIWELVLHLEQTIDILLGRLAGTIGAVEDELYWIQPDEQTESAWESTLESLRARHAALAAAVAGVDPARLDAPIFPGGSSTYNNLIGHAQHNAYHTGQIALLKRLLAAPAA